MRSIYLDHAATTPLYERVLQAMMPYFGEHYGNPSSVHKLGRRARYTVEESRECVAELLGAEPGEIIFTSGGSEANNTAIRGLLAEDGHLITSAAEHEAVLETAEALERQGRPVTVLSPKSQGAVTAEQVAGALTEETRLVSLMLVNNELGTVTNIQEIAALCREYGVYLHCDAVQAPGMVPLDVEGLGVDLLSLSAHKFYGPKGAGLLYVRGGVELEPLIRGGSQERDRRAGTENVPGIVGLTEALALAIGEREERAADVRSLRNRLYQNVKAELGDDFVLNTPLEDPVVETAPHILNLSFAPEEGEAIDGEMLLLNLDMEGVHASAGSACTSGALEPSHVLSAIGRDKYTGSAAVRFSLGHRNTAEEVDYAARTLAEVVGRMRGREEAAGIS